MSITTANVTTSVGNAYVSSGNTAVTFFMLHNYSASNVVANVYVVPNGTSADNLNAIISNLQITSDNSYQLYAANEKLVLANGDSIQVSAGANNSINTVTSYTSF